MTTIVEICNDALSNIRANSINSLNEASREAQVCKLKFPLVRDKLLRQYNWTFATVEVALGELALTAPRWRKVYNYPSDALNIQMLYPSAVSLDAADRASGLTIYGTQEQRLDYRLVYEITHIEGKKVIVCNSDDVIARYTKQIIDPNLYGSLFVMTLSWYLSSQIAIPLMGQGKGRGEKAVAEAEYRSLLPQAVKADDEESYHPQEFESEFLSGRL